MSTGQIFADDNILAELEKNPKLKKFQYFSVKSFNLKISYSYFFNSTDEAVVECIFSSVVEDELTHTAELSEVAISLSVLSK